MLLSKSKFMIGLQCPVWLWKSFNAKHELPEIDAATQAKFDTGHRVGELAQTLFSGGFIIPTGNFSANLDITKQKISERIPLFEAGFLVEDLFARPDILQPVENDEWDNIEVKSSTDVKPQYLYDLAFQKYVYEKAGLKIRNSFVMHLNKEYYKQGDINPEQLFVKEDVTKQVEELFPEIPGLIEEQWQIIKSPICPEAKLVGQCESFYGCPVHDELYANLPSGNIFELYYNKAKAAELYQSGVKDLGVIPTDTKINAKNQIQVEAARTGETHIEQEKIKEWLGNLQYPLYYFDFETESFAVPYHNNTKPYQQVPMQWSLHIEQEDGSVEHKEFLHDSKEDPRPPLLAALKDALQGAGSIITYNQSFEINRLKEMAAAFPEHQEWIDEAINKIVDLIIPFRQFWYYSPEQKGKCGLKYTMPALLGKDHYAELDVHDGGTAQMEYMRITYQDVPEEEKRKIREDLLKYCCLDTEGMVWMINKLKLTLSQK